MEIIKGRLISLGHNIVFPDDPRSSRIVSAITVNGTPDIVLIWENDQVKLEDLKRTINENADFVSRVGFIAVLPSICVANKRCSFLGHLGIHVIVIHDEGKPALADVLVECLDTLHADLTKKGIVLKANIPTRASPWGCSVSSPVTAHVNQAPRQSNNFPERPMPRRNHEKKRDDPIFDECQRGPLLILPRDLRKSVDNVRVMIDEMTVTLSREGYNLLSSIAAHEPCVYVKSIPGTVNFHSAAKNAVTLVRTINNKLRETPYQCCVTEELGRRCIVYRLVKART